MGASVWDKEGAVEELKKLRNAGMSASRIAAAISFKFNHDISRNAVLGKLDRMGLGLLGTVRDGHRVRKPRRARAERRASPQPQRIPPLRRALEMAPEPLPESSPDDIARISFAELESHLCHWIPGNPSEGDALTSKKYCGLPIVHGAPSPYCLGHLKRAFRPLEEQPRDFRRQFANDNASKAPSREMEEA